MNQNNPTTSYELRDKIDLFLSKWKLILLSLIICIGLAYIYLRYATYVYQATTTIKINSEKKSERLPELAALQDYGLFSKNFANVADEIEIIKSRTLIRRVVKDLKLNKRYFVRGKIKEQEVYTNPPIVVSFFESDSLLNLVDTTLYVKIKSPTKFTLSNEESNELLEIESSNAREYAFGDRIKTGFGDIIITPSINENNIISEKSIKIQMLPVEKVVEQYQKMITVAPAKEASNILNITLTENIREKAKLILDKVVEEYNNEVISDKQLVVQATSDFINNRLEIVSNELEKIDLTAETLQKNHRLTALATQSDIFLQSEKENETKLVSTSNQIQLVDYMKDYLAENDTNSELLPADIGISDSNVNQITKSYNELVLQRNRILKTSTEKNPTVINLNNEIAALRNNLNQSLNNIQTTNEITLNSLKREDARISSQIYSAPTKARQFRDVARQQNIKESLFLYLLQKREETAISFGISTPNAKVIDTAYASYKPESPKKTTVYLAALILGLFLPLSIIYLLDILDTKIRSKNDVLKLISAPFIGDIPRSKTKARLVKSIDYSPKAEAFRIIRTNINFMLQEIDTKCKTIFVTSTTSQEGKSHTSINLASSFSFSEKRTLIIETDIRVPRVNDYLNIKSDIGLTNFISDKSLNVEDVIVKAKDNPFLDVIPSGAIPPNPAELLMSDRLKHLFDTVKKKYDYIIVDTAAVGLVTDTLLISKFADMFIYVVSANNIDKRQLHIAQTMYTEKRLPNMAVLLNGTLHKRGYGYGYGNNPNRKKKWYQFK